MNFFAVQVYISPVKMVLFQTCSLICLVQLLPYIFSLFFDLTLGRKHSTDESSENCRCYPAKSVLCKWKSS